MNKQLDYFKYYKRPYTTDYLYVWSNENDMVFSCIEEDDNNLIDKVLNILNSNTTDRFESVEYRDEIIYINNEPILLIRGWGSLTSPCHHNLSPEQAVKVQDDFCNWCVSKLLGNEK